LRKERGLAVNAKGSGSDTEVDALFAEAVELDRQGKLDEAGLARLDAGMQAHFDRLNQEHAQRIAEIEARFAAARPRTLTLPQRFRIPALAVLVIVAVGSILELTVGQAFVFSLGNYYRAAIPWLFPGLLVLFGVAWFLVERASGPIKARYPTLWVRELFAFPLIAAICAAMVLIAPLGWAALSGWVLGSASEDMDGRISYIGSRSSNWRSCPQYVELEVIDSSASVCLGGWPPGQEPKAGESVVVRGRRSILGVMVEEVRRK
jgi:hypothetical protein